MGGIEMKVTHTQPTPNLIINSYHEIWNFHYRGKEGGLREIREEGGRGIECIQRDTWGIDENLSGDRIVKERREGGITNGMV
jgi:hypothetical protein